MEAIKTIIEILAAVGVGVIAGNGAVYGFNHIPAEWFTPDGCEPTEEVLSRDRQRIPSYPWKYIMNLALMAAGKIIEQQINADGAQERIVDQVIEEAGKSGWQK